MSSGFAIVDLVIGMIFIYFLLSIICSSAVELWISMRRTRARLLQEWLVKIFSQPALDPTGQHLRGKNLGQAIMDHCMITALTKSKKSPSYINASDFATALLDQITRTTPTDGTAVARPPSDLSGLISAIQNTPVLSGELKRTLLIYANEAQQAAALLDSLPKTPGLVSNVTVAVKTEIDHFRERLEQWYDSNSERLTATFKRDKIMPATVLVAICITIGLNADSVAISRYLYDHKEITKDFADKALNTFVNYKERIDSMKTRVDTAKSSDQVMLQNLDNNLAQLRGDIDSLHKAVPEDLPLGWKNGHIDLKKFPGHLLGWLATILAICLGAPFWFDILNKIANLRGSGAKPATSGK